MKEFKVSPRWIVAQEGSRQTYAVPVGFSMSANALKTVLRYGLPSNARMIQKLAFENREEQRREHVLNHA